MYIHETQMLATRLVFVLAWLSTALAGGHSTIRPPHRPRRLGRGGPPLPWGQPPNASASVIDPSQKMTVDVAAPSSLSARWAETPVVLGLVSAMLCHGLLDIWASKASQQQAAHTRARMPGNLLHTTILYCISHSDPIHFLVNLAMTYGFGSQIERRDGSRRTSVLLASVVLGGGLINLVGCERFGQCQGRGSSGIALALLSAYRCSRVLEAPAKPRATRQTVFDAWAFVRSCLLVLGVELALLGANLSLRIHVYGVVVGAMFAIFDKRG